MVEMGTTLIIITTIDSGWYYQPNDELITIA